MFNRKFVNLVLLIAVVASLITAGGAPVSAQKPNPSGDNPKMAQMDAMQGPQPPDKQGHPSGQMRTMTPAERKAARLKQPAQQKGVSATYAGVNPATAKLSPLATVQGAPVAGPTALAPMAAPFSAPDYFGVQNWANSPLPTIAPVTGAISGGMRKFVDTLPPLCPLGVNDLGQCISVATPDVTTFPGSDYYEISLVQYNEQMHLDLPGPLNVNGGTGTLLRGYVQTNGPLGLAQLPHYLGPLIIAQGCEPHAAANTPATPCTPRPVRVKFTNKLPTGSPGGDLFIPTDTTYMGAGMGPQGVVARINVGNAGAGYTVAPVVTIAAPPAGGIRATAVATVAGGLVTGIMVTNEGAGYAAGSSPVVTIAAPPAGGTQATAVAVVPVAGEQYTENRATLHLHGGNSPWISDGTPHQWITPATESTSYRAGLSQRNVPDMWFDATTHAPVPGCAGQTTCGVANASNDPGPGSETFYWTNQQGGRLMFYHDHAYGLTRLNVYVGEAAGYLNVDKNAETQLRTATVPGTITDPANPTNLTANDVMHLYPLVIQDKTFVPDDGAAGGQLAATDPTWPSPANPLPGTTGWGKGKLWFPHVYMPNQNPADVTGANAFGRWDYGPWFWPPQNPATLVSLPYLCDSSAYSAANPPAFPPLYCPGTPNPSGVPEGFMDTPLVNGTAYPTLTIDPAAYRFSILSAGNDRALSLGLYVAEPLSVALTNSGAGYAAAPVPSISGGTGGGAGAAASVTVSTGNVTAILVTGVGSGYTATPNVTITGDGGGATATAVIDPISGQVTAVNVTNIGSGYTFANVAIDPPAGCQTGCITASASATIAPAGSILSITVTNPGSAPWTAAPTVTIPAPTCSPLGTATCAQATAIASVNTEVKMVDAVPHTALSIVPLCAPTQVGGANLALATLDAGGNPINGTGLPANCYPTTWPTDGRDGGVPDPLTAGPPFIQIGTEGGLLPAPVVIPSTPTGYEYNRRSITVLNIFNHGLLLGPAERADVVVDFSNPKWAGKTLILYNDAPAPVPAFDPRNDYYTGSPDQTLTGGAPSTLPGYGPNTRTIMQIKVNATGTANGFSLPALSAALPSIFASTQDRIIMPEPAFPAGNGGAATPTYVRIQDNSISAWLNVPIGGLTLTSISSGYTAAPNVDIAAPTCTPLGTPLCAKATGAATLSPTSIASVALSNAGGFGYITPPAVTFTPVGPGSGAAATAVLSTDSGVRSIAVGAGGSGYLLAPTVNIAAPTCSPLGTATCASATAQATVRGNGQRNVTGINVLTPGAGYTGVPAVSFTPVSGGSGASATAALGRRVVGFTVTGGSGYTSAPGVTVAPTPAANCVPATVCAGATAAATLTPTSVASLTVTNGGNGYTAAPAVTIDPPQTAGGRRATGIAVANTPLLPKAIQELFTLDYGRMNATLGVEIPRTNFLIQTTIPYGYIDPPTEIFKDGEVQFWKITHNGVDTHWIHFHLFNVQVINRVGWDGAVKPPDPNELSWKDTVRMNPLEDIVVALRPLSQQKINATDLDLSNLPNSIRPLDVTEAPGSAVGFTNVDPTNQPATVTNDLTNFGYEYVWHCHILGHEENDMMRAMALVVPPNAAPSGLTATVGGTTQAPLAVLTFTDNSVNESAWIVQRSSNGGTTWNTATTVQSTTGPGTGSVSFTVAQPRKTTYVYQVIASNVVGYTKKYAAPAVGYPSASANSGPTNTSAAVVTN